MEQRSEQWFSARVGKITGSRIGAILGASPYSTPMDVLREMVREHFRAPREFAGNEATRWGEAHEPVAREQYELEQGVFVTETGLVNHPVYDFLAASPDGLINLEGLVEFKCPFSRRIKPLEAMPHYEAQVQLALACTGRQWCDYVVWTPDEMVCERTTVKKDFIENRLETLEAFINEYRQIIHDENKARPFLKSREQVREDPSWTTLASEYARNNEQIKTLQAQQKKVRDALIKKAEGIRTTGAGITVYPGYRSSLDEEQLKKDYPDIDLDAYRRKSIQPVWQIRVQEKKQ